jgi:hypothetical protein
MSPELIISALARLNELLESKHHEQKKKYKQLQMMLIILSSSVALVLFVIYHASPLQMLFVLFAFNFLFFIGFKPRARYGEKNVKTMMAKVVALQIKLQKFLGDEQVSFDGVTCSQEEGWTCDKWGLYKDDERIDYGVFLYEKDIKGLYLEALRGRR